MNMRKYLTAIIALFTVHTINAQVISFSMEAEASDKNTPEGWTEVDLPKDLPNFTDANTFYITNYGASTESADNTKAIQDALNAASSAGGGMVVIPAGEWLCNTIQVGSKTVLHLCAGATLKWLAYGDRSITEGNNFIINKNTPYDVVIEGEGNTSIIEGQGGPWWEHYKDSGVKRGAVIRFSKGNRFLLRNFRIQNAPGANLTVGQSGNGAHTTVHDIEIANPSSSASTPSHNTDGIPVWTQYVNIYNCTIDTGDDNVVCDSKAQYVHVWNCDFKAGHGASLGSYTVDMHNIIYENLTLDGTDSGFRLKSNNDRSGDVHDIIFRNCTMKNVASPISITTWYDLSYDKLNPTTIAASPEEVKSTTPVYHNILIQNVTATGYDNKNSNDKNYNGIYIYGRPESYVYDVTFDNVQISHRNGVRLFFCKDIKFINGCTFTKTRTNQTVSADAKDLSDVMENSYEATYTWNKGTSDIENIISYGSIMNSDKYFSIQGCQLPSKPVSRGIYIHNGKKIIIR